MEYIKAYGGNDSYIFISYAHRDAESVLPIIKNLINNGYRTWYDEGIEPGKSWDDYIADHVLGCSYFIAFVSPSYLASSNCMDELNFARDENKKLLLVYLSPVDLPAGMRMRLNRLQAINKYAFQNKSDFFRKLYTAEGIEITLEKSASQYSTPDKTTITQREIKTVEFENYTYTGQILNGEANGRGKIVWKKGGEWEGVWLNNKPVSGDGTWYRADGIYNGKLKSNGPNGFGRIKWLKGGEWEGEWGAGKPVNGKGSIHFPNGNSYEGELKQGKANGYGKIIWVKGGSWEGTWINNNVINGKGVYYYSNGDIYIGDFRNGKPNGFGKVTWIKGGEWEGEWKDGIAFNGRGAIHCGNGNVYWGTRHNGKSNGQGRIRWALGGEWQGEWKDDQPFSGNGSVYLYKNQVLDARYDGEFRNGQCNGIGTMYWATNSNNGKRVITGQYSITGEWRNHRIWHGEGNNAPNEPRQKVRNGRIVLF